jgi:ferredoxin-NADP reductase
MPATTTTSGVFNDYKPWDSHQEELVCTRIAQDSSDVKTFYFQTVSPSWFRYAPGQFVTLEIQIDGQWHSRCYTWSSSPSRPVCLSITVKAESAGTVSRWLHQRLRIGDRVRARGPCGLFSLQHHPAGKYLFLAGGVGITPLMSMARWLFDLGRQADVSFVQCARTPADLLFRDELESFSTRMPDFRVALVCERPNPIGAWTGYGGRLDRNMLALICPDVAEREIFCCGPAPYMAAVRAMLQLAGFDMARYHEESFAAPLPAAADPVIGSSADAGASQGAYVKFAASGVTAQCRQTDTLLDVAREAGLYIPSACQFGVCGTCKVRKLEGAVMMVASGGITVEDEQAGWVLACCSRPVGLVILDC